MQILGVLAAIGFFVMGLVQLAAIMGGLKIWIGLSGFLGFVVAGFLAYFPLVGSVLGMYGAVTLWGWSWLGAAALFLWPLALGLAVAAVGAVAERVEG
jgi:hypothetical protein